jgi:hypothetical protein
MVQVRGTRWPGRIHKSVVDELLNIVNHPAFEIFGIIREQSYASYCLFHGFLVATAHSLSQITFKQPNHTNYITL